jgi:hypothetical protein
MPDTTDLAEQRGEAPEDVVEGVAPLGKRPRRTIRSTTLLSRDDLKLPVFPAQAVPHAIMVKAPLGRAKVMLFSGRPLR